MKSGQLEKIRDLVTDDFVDHGFPAGHRPTGRPFAMKTAHFFRARDGRLCEHWGVRDELDVLYQVGALTPPEMPRPERD